MTSHEWLRQLAGKFVVFDGPDGSGKSTQFRRFADFAREHELSVQEVREPGGTMIGEEIRKVLLDPKSEMSLRCEMLLYMASRAQLIEEVIGPALKRKALVLSDRFISSTLAYQGTAGGLPEADILKVGEVAIGRHQPDAVVIFDVDEMTAAKRMAGGSTRDRKSGATAAQPSLFADRLELRGIEYQRRVRKGYLDQAQHDPHRYIVIDASKEPDAIFESLLKALAAHGWK